MECGGITFDEPTPSTATEVDSIPTSGPVSVRLRAILDADFKFQLKDNPEFASQAGFHEHGGELQSLFPRDWENRQAHNTAILEKIDGLDLTAEDVSEEQRLHAQLLKAAMKDESQAIELGCHLMPINSIGIGGVYNNFIETVEFMPFETEEDFVKYLGRLMAFPKQVEGFQDLLAYGRGMRGITASKSMMRGVAERMKQLIEGDLAELHAPLEGKTVDPELVEQIKQAIEHCFRGSLRRIQDFLVGFYGSCARADPGVKAVRNGAEIYAVCLKYHTTTSKTAEEIHEMGLREVARIEGRFQTEVLDAVGFTGTLVEFAEGLKKDSSMRYDSEEELLAGYRALMERIQAKLPKFFKRLPKMPLEVVANKRGPMAYYLAGTPDGKRPGRFYVNVSRLEERGKYMMPALALHEGVPGHHLQLALALENENLPDFLRYIEDRRYEYCPARRPLYTGYAEGWALYCEWLGEEMEMYTTPQELFGRLSMEMWRAIRLVVDTGIHAFDWSVERAAAFMEEKSGMPTADCLEECHRYAAWPGQACAYKVGELALREIRSSAEAALGEFFDCREFHDLVLSAGSLPLDILKERVGAWVSATTAASTAAST